MEDIFTIEFPNTISDSELATLETELKQMAEVENAGSMDARSVDPQALMLWVQLVSGALAAVSTGVPIIQKIAGMFQGRGIKGAKIALPDGTTVSIDDVSPQDLENLIKTLKQ
jgi:hypothetical protein